MQAIIKNSNGYRIIGNATGCTPQRLNIFALGIWSCCPWRAGKCSSSGSALIRDGDVLITHFSLSCHHIYFRPKYFPEHHVLTIRDNSVSTETMLQYRQPRDQCSAPSRDKRSYSSPQHLQTNAGAYSLTPKTLFWRGSQGMELTTHLHLTCK
jgi:hypothetical protein